MLYIINITLPAIAIYFKRKQDDINSMMYALNVFLIIRVVADVCLFGILMFDLTTAYDKANLAFSTIAILASAHFASARVRIYFSTYLALVVGLVTYVL
jgi:hypothetical protein